VGAHCWGSEESGALSPAERGSGGLVLRYHGPGCAGPACGCRCGVGLLFEIWIVDASIFVVCCVHCHAWFICGRWLVGMSGLRFFFCRVPFGGFGRGWGWGLFVCLVGGWWVGWVGGVCDKL
jgi:hypothetical protein